MKGKFKKSLSAIAKTAVITILIVLCFTLPACDPVHIKFKQEDLAEVVSIELINYDNPKRKKFASWVPDHSADLNPIDDSQMSNLEILDESKIPDFIDDLCEKGIFDRYYTYDSPDGICIKLNYANGNYLIIAKRYIGIFSSSGEVVQYIGCFGISNSYKTLVNDYFQTQIQE